MASYGRFVVVVVVVVVFVCLFVCFVSVLFFSTRRPLARLTLLI